MVIWQSGQIAYALYTRVKAVLSPLVTLNAKTTLTKGEKLREGRLEVTQGFIAAGQIEDQTEIPGPPRSSREGRPSLCCVLSAYPVPAPGRQICPQPTHISQLNRHQSSHLKLCRVPLSSWFLLPSAGLYETGTALEFPQRYSGRNYVNTLTVIYLINLPADQTAPGAPMIYTYSGMRDSVRLFGSWLEGTNHRHTYNAMHSHGGLLVA